ncbi:flagellar biosynthetic protein FliQ [Coprothermobacter platensis]|uniref:flagellar biosynthetic protein FliQ n=1 Tax=Coprothermobacter platensis TaxID=108819 RepID=UPI00036C1C92|nr:flagellar biosynthetic protein FliQ [Coprothermobacter platensis]
MIDFVFTWFRNSIMQIIILVGPVLLVALVLGIVISILQVLTQIHDASVAFVPKFLVIMLMVLFLGGTAINVMTKFFVSVVSAWQTIP